MGKRGKTYLDWLQESSAIRNPRDRALFEAQHRDEIAAALRRQQREERKADRADMEEVKEEIAEELEEERVSKVAVNVNQIPPEWIIDGSWAQLSPSQKAVVVVIFRHFTPDGRPVRISRGLIAEESGIHPTTVSATTEALHFAGWVQKKIHRKKGTWKTITWYYPPKIGKRRVRTRPGKDSASEESDE